MIPTRPADCDRGGIPTIDCPPIPVIDYTIPVVGQWNAEIADVPPEFVPYLAVGTLVSSIVPAPPGDGTLLQELGFAPVLSPIVGPPTPEDVPGTWSILAPESPTGFVGVLLPLIYTSMIAPPGQPFWLRARYVDGNGCETFAYIYVASGLQDEPSEVTLYAVVNDEVYELTVEAPEEPDQPGPATDTLEITATPTCPDTGRYVPVGPACGADAIPVRQAVAEHSVAIFAVNDGQNVDLERSASVVVRRMDATGGTSEVRVTVGGVGTYYVMASGEVLRLEAPPGGWLETLNVACIDGATAGIVQVIAP